MTYYLGHFNIAVAIGSSIVATLVGGVLLALFLTSDRIVRFDAERYQLQIFLNRWYRTPQKVYAKGLIHGIEYRTVVIRSHTLHAVFLSLEGEQLLLKRFRTKQAAESYMLWLDPVLSLRRIH